MVGETAPGKIEAVATIQTQKSARTIASDRTVHKLYLPAAEYGPPAPGKQDKKGRPPILENSFAIVVVGR